MSFLSYLKQQPLQGIEGGVRSRTVGLMRLMLAATGLCIFALNPETGTTAYARNTYQLTLYFAYAYCVYATLLFALPATMLRILRLGWLQDANTGLFVVYNDTRELGRYDFVTPTTGRSLILKFSRMFDVLN